MKDGEELDRDSVTDARTWRERSPQGAFPVSFRSGMERMQDVPGPGTCPNAAGSLPEPAADRIASGAPA